MNEITIHKPLVKSLEKQQKKKLVNHQIPYKITARTPVQGDSYRCSLSGHKM
jgi:hypothetical protein